MLLTAGWPQDRAGSTERPDDPAPNGWEAAETAAWIAPRGRAHCSEPCGVWSGEAWLLPSGAGEDAPATSVASGVGTAWTSPPPSGHRT